MKCRNLSSILTLVLVALLTGCGSDSSITKQDLPGNSNAKASDRPAGQSALGATAGPTATIARLLEGVPNSQYPKAGPLGYLEGDEGKPKWLSEKVVGHQLDFTLRVEDVQVESASNDTFNVDLLFPKEEHATELPTIQNNVTIDNLKIGNLSCQVMVWASSPLWSGLDAATAEERRGLAGRQAQFRARIADAEFSGGGSQLLLALSLEDIQLVGVVKDSSPKEPQPVPNTVAETIGSDKLSRTVQKDGWIKIQHGPCSFSLPVDPESTRLERKPGYFVTAYNAVWEGLEFIAIVGDQPSEEIVRETLAIGDELDLLMAGRDRTYQEFSGTLLSDQFYRFGKHNAWDSTVSTPDGYTRRFNNMIVYDRDCQLVFGSTNPADVEGDVAEKFFKSFAYDESAKPAGAASHAGIEVEVGKPLTFRGKRHQLFPDVVSWKTAKERCEKLGGRLAVVSDAEHNQFLTALIIKSGLREAWLGATDEAAERKWVSVAGTPLEYVNWNKGQPNNTGNREHYLLLWASSRGKWADQPNEAIQPHKPGYICQWD